MLMGLVGLLTVPLIESIHRVLSMLRKNGRGVHHAYRLLGVEAPIGIFYII